MREAPGDRELMQALERDLVVPLEPSAGERDTFLAVVSDAGARAGSQRRWTRRVLAALAAGLVVSGGTTAYAVAEGLPRPVRRVATVLRLPVDSPELVDARDALDTLEDAVEKGETSRVDDALDDVERSLDALDRDERDEVEDRAGVLAERARETEEDRFEPSTRVDGDSGDDDDSNRGTEPTTSTTEVEDRSDDSGSGSGSDTDERDSASTDSESSDESESSEESEDNSGQG